MIAAGHESDVSDSDCDLIIHDSKYDNNEFVAVPASAVNNIVNSKQEEATDNATFLHNNNSSTHSTRSYGEKEKHWQKNKTSHVVINRDQPLDDLRYAIMQGNIDVVKSAVLEQEIDVDTILKAGWTCLMYACSAGMPEIVQFLLEHKADPNFNKDMFTPLMAVCASSKNEGNLLKCCELLLEYGAKVNAYERHSTTPLMFAAREGHLKIVEELLKHDVNINYRDNRGRTALAWAASCGYGQIVRILLEKNANSKIVDNYGQLPSELAYNQGYKEIAALLEKNADQNINFDSLEERQQDMRITSSSDCNTEIIKKALKTKPLPELNQTVLKHGELELFLTGLQLPDLLPVFYKHQLNFSDLLIMNEDDLEKIGIEQVGVRKKILEATKDVHRKEWKNSSLPNLKQCQYISCPDAVAMMSNIAKHLKYITATIVYVKKQIETEPKILEFAQDSSNVYDLLDEMEDSMTNVKNLSGELQLLKLHLDGVRDNVKYKPADKIVENVYKKNIKKNLIIGFTVISFVIGSIWWKKSEALKNATSTVLSKVPFIKVQIYS